MTDYRITCTVHPRVYLAAARPARGLDGTRATPPTWRNEFWKDTPEWARPIFESLSQFLARPTFWNGILVGDGVGPQRDPDTGIWTFPSAPLPIDANGVGGDPDAPATGTTASPIINGGVSTVPSRTTIYAWSMQSDNYANNGNPWPGWRLDRSGWAHFDTIAANNIVSRGSHLHFQFNGNNPDAFDRSSVSINSEGVLSAPVINTANIIHSENHGPLEDLWLNDGVVVHPGGWLDAHRITVQGVDVSLEGHTHDEYLTQTEGDARYSLLGHTHTGSQTFSSVTTTTIDHGSGGNVAITSGVATPVIASPSGSGGTIAVTGTLDATGLKVGGTTVSLSTHTHAHSSNTGLGNDDHTQYHNDARGDARYSLLGHTHSAPSLSSIGIARGYKNDTTDGSGKITVAHGLGSRPISVVAISTANNSSGSDSGIGTPSIGGAGINLVIHNVDSTNFDVWVHDSTVGGAAIGSLNVAFYWIAVL